MPQTPDEQKAIIQRMIDAGESEENLATIVRHFKGTTPPNQRSWFDTITDWLPTAGGAVGGWFGGPAGAVVGGAAGEGLKVTAQHATEIPGAMVDVARNLVAHPKETIQGGLQGMGEGLVNAGVSGGEQGLMEGAGRAVTGLASRGASVLMQSALKPSTVNTAKALIKGVGVEDLPIIQTMLKEGVQVSPSGIQKLTNIMSASNKELDDVLARAHGKIYPAKVAQRADDVLKSFSTQTNKRADVAAIRNTKQEFVEDYVRDPATGRMRKALSPLEAQELKTGTYRSLGRKAYTGELKGAEVETQKALARGLKEEIEAATSSQGLKGSTGRTVAQINAREGAAIEAREAVARRVAAAANRDPVALAWLAHNPAASLAFIVERSPAVKSMLARGLYQSASKAARVPENVIRAVVQALATTSEDDQ